MRYQIRENLILWGVILSLALSVFNLVYTQIHFHHVDISSPYSFSNQTKGVTDETTSNSQNLTQLEGSSEINPEIETTNKVTDNTETQSMSTFQIEEYIKSQFEKGVTSLHASVFAKYPQIADLDKKIKDSADAYTTANLAYVTDKFHGSVPDFTLAQEKTSVESLQTKEEELKQERDSAIKIEMAEYDKEFPVFKANFCSNIDIVPKSEVDYCNSLSN